MVKLTEEQKLYISNAYSVEQKAGKKIREEFKVEYGFEPAASTINKYQNYKDIKDEISAETKEPEKKEEPSGPLELETEDTRKIKDVFDFSGGDIPDEVFDKLADTFGHSKKKLFDVMKKARDEGYKTVNLKTGELTK